MTMSVSGSFSADGDTSGLTVLGWYGCFVYINGTFGGGTVTASFYAADASWRALTSFSATVNGEYMVDVPDDTQVRLTLTGSTSPALYYQISSKSAG